MIAVRIRNGIAPNISSGLGGATEGDLRGSLADMISSTGGVVDVAAGQLAVSQVGGGAMSVAVADGIAYVPNASFSQFDSDSIKFWEVVVASQANLTIGSNSSGSTRIDLICVKLDTTITPNEFASNIATVVVVAGTPGAGIPATPSNHLKLYEITVANGAVSILTASITDKRVQIALNYKLLTDLGIFAADAGSTDAYAITLPGITAYRSGQIFSFTANTINTGAASLNVNSLGAKTIKKLHDQDLADGDIEVGSVVLVQYDGTNMQMLSQIANSGGGTAASQTEVNTGTDSAKFITPSTFNNSIYKNAPQGFLLNGKIVVSVASNNITVAIKGMDGNNPSASNPVYCRIGDTVRAITSALSVTKNAGTNWFGSGGATLATLERDYFVYLGYNATDGVVIGFSPVPYATSYGDFSATTTNEKYAAISTITTAASTDYYENIGRFAATLSATASFNWSVPTFNATNLIQRPITETRWLTFTPTYSTDGSAFTNAPTTNTALYKIFGINQIYIRVRFTYNATSGGTGGTIITIPFTPAYTMQSGFGSNYNNGGGLNVRTNGTATQLYVTASGSGTNIANSQGSDVGLILDW